MEDIATAHLSRSLRSLSERCLQVDSLSGAKNLSPVLWQVKSDTQHKCSVAIIHISLRQSYALLHGLVPFSATFFPGKHAIKPSLCEYSSESANTS